jgi:hypothetical protein
VGTGVQTTPRAGTPSNPRVTSTTAGTITLGRDGPDNAGYLLRSGIQIATVTGRSFTDIGLFPYAPWVEAGNGSGRQMSSFDRCHDEWWRHRFPGG